MIKNIIFDIGGIIFDDSITNISNVLKEDASELYKKVYDKSFVNCLLGNQSIEDYIETFKDDASYEKIKYLLNDLYVSFPLIKENFDYILNLKDRGYNLYLLSNITKESYDYIKSVIDIDKVFSGGVYSYQEGIIKPDKKIYELIIDKYGLNKDETIFFDDRQKNVDVAIEAGIKSILFKSVEDIESNINEYYSKDI